MLRLNDYKRILYLPKRVNCYEMLISVTEKSLKSHYNDTVFFPKCVFGHNYLCQCSI